MRGVFVGRSVNACVSVYLLMVTLLIFICHLQAFVVRRSSRQQPHDPHHRRRRRACRREPSPPSLALSIRHPDFPSHSVQHYLILNGVEDAQEDQGIARSYSLIDIQSFSHPIVCEISSCLFWEFPSPAWAVASCSSSPQAGNLPKTKPKNLYK